MRTLPKILAALTFSVMGSAFAEAPYPPEQPLTSGLSRAQVMQELADAKGQGLLVQGDARYPVIVAPSAPMQQQLSDRHTEKKDARDDIYAGA